MMRLISIVCILLLVTSCKDNSIKPPEKPKNLISKDKMVDILYDMSLLSAAKGVNKRALESKGINPEAFIYEKYEIDSLQFAESNNYYAYDIKTYDDLFSRVKLKLQADKKAFNKEIEIEKRRLDSIRKSRQNPTKDTLRDRSRSSTKKIKPNL
ncbi:MAG: DUF4296 domain-containing protein [Bacteroidia bacterium]|nr:DUF4296 domain-containing protein [Bacteroidia bacterium]NND24488.1 DUF4296 domain-containing protein [Flavobacteriaceae bacterium]MBT8277447.1 DUF4296 domain-containing protein [Bacteroidia bacterium]NNK60791.1 DUF4296 domain-containing protein [Flavobacteriaceae bacterium]NNL32841.1 DUF4296 domain-containing protein [Flavobacteriaceae bacterium]